MSTQIFKNIIPKDFQEHSLPKKYIRRSVSYLDFLVVIKFLASVLISHTIFTFHKSV